MSIFNLNLNADQVEHILTSQIERFWIETPGRLESSPVYRLRIGLASGILVTGVYSTEKLQREQYAELLRLVDTSPQDPAIQAPVIHEELFRCPGSQSGCLLACDHHGLHSKLDDCKVACVHNGGFQISGCAPQL